MLVFPENVLEDVLEGVLEGTFKNEVYHNLGYLD